MDSQMIKTQNQLNAGACQMARTVLNPNSQGSLRSTSSQRNEGTMNSTLTSNSMKFTSVQGTLATSSLTNVASTSTQKNLSIKTSQGTIKATSSPKYMASTSSQQIFAKPEKKSVACTSSQREVPNKPYERTMITTFIPKSLASTSLQGPLVTSISTSMGNKSTKIMMPCLVPITSKPASTSVASTSTQRKEPSKPNQRRMPATSSPMCMAGTSTQENVANISSNNVSMVKKAERVPFIPYDCDALNECVSHFPKDENGDTMPLLNQPRADMDFFSEKFDELKLKNNQKVRKIRAVQVPADSFISNKRNELKKAEHAMNNITTVSNNDEDNELMTNENILKSILAQEDETEEIPREVLENCEKAKSLDADFQLQYVKKFLAGNPIDTSYHPTKVREYMETGEYISSERSEARKKNIQKSRESHMKDKKRRIFYKATVEYLRESISNTIAQFVTMKKMLNGEYNGKLLELIGNSNNENGYEHDFMGNNSDGTQFSSYQPVTNMAKKRKITDNGGKS
ncbi:uncharacterized protein LOC116350036 isoform X2 [Contarinia nasturtii]|nr:uncharacterized protein LOC116350036 isoform X2 [Contarinia nasturtii]